MTKLIRLSIIILVLAATASCTRTKKIQVKKEESTVLIHGGAVHFGKDTALINGEPVFAAGWKLKNKGEEFAGEKLAFIKEETEEKGGNISITTGDSVSELYEVGGNGYGMPNKCH